jgi:hypothetical protein
MPTPALGTGGELSSVSCQAVSDCVAVGYEVVADETEPLVESWNGTSWTVEATPTPAGGYDFDLEGVSCNSATACTAVGVYTESATLAALVERWDGTTWTLQATPAIDGYLVGVSCSTATSCTAVGNSYSFPGHSRIGALAEFWNGRTWRIQKTPAVGSGYVQLYGVSCGSPTECTAVGGYGDSAGVAVTVAEARDGSGWSVETTPNPSGGNAVLAAVADRTPSSCIAVGSHADPAGVSLTLAEVRG